MTVDADGKLALRQDARRNRERLVKAATEVFSEQGLDASLGEVARRAGVGDATLYRRFPTRADLYAAVYAEAQEAVHQFGEQALLVEDGWTALCLYLERACEFTATNRAVSDLVMATVPDTPSPVEGWDRGKEILVELIGRAKRQGSLHADVTLEDILFALYSVQLMVPASRDIAPDAWRRQLAFILRGLHANGTSALPSTPTLSEEQLQSIAPRLFLRRAADRSR